MGAKNCRKRRAQRHADAIARSHDRAARSDAEQLALIETRRGESKKEKARILASHQGVLNAG